MENFFSRIRQNKTGGKWPTKKELNAIVHSFSKREHEFFVGLVIILILSTLFILQNINESFMVDVPRAGGKTSIGIAGTPRFINPVLANTTTDEDLVALIYSGLTRKSPDGGVIPDLAEKYEMSENGLDYTFTLKEGLSFHDGEPLTADDVIFTINTIRDSIIQSPQKVEWEGVTVSKVDEKTIKFELRQPFSSFLENATIGIMPEHIWSDSPVELNERNIDPVGSGPYLIKETSKHSSGVIESLELRAFEEFALGEPYIEKMSLRFYANEGDLVRAVTTREVEQVSSLSPENAEILEEKGLKIESSVLPRVFGLFFNQSINQIFVDKAVVSAINEGIDKERIIRDVLMGYGVVIDSPIPPNIVSGKNSVIAKQETREAVVTNVKANLEKAGWKPGVDGFLEKSVTDKGKKVTTKLAFSISTGNAPELAKTAELIKENLEELGMQVEVKTFEIGNLNQDVIRPRKYDALLFGEIVNRESDLFAFWHSSQRKDPGLNVAMYTNAKVDKMLEEASVILDKADREKKYLEFAEEVKKDMQAVFLYSPEFIYIVPKDLKNFEMKSLISPSEHYLNAHLWYTQTEKVWKIFARQ